MATERQRRGALAEDQVAAYLAELGWRVVRRNLKVGRDEVDIVAIDPGPPVELVCVEVRSAASSAFGSPEERVDRAKVAHLYRAMRLVVASSSLPGRVDLVVVDQREGRPVIRHLRRLEPA